MVEADCSSINQSYPSLSDETVLATQITSGITCILSTLGASLIIFTYAAFKSLRTTARQLLACLSLADITVALSHFLGLFTNYRRFIYIVESDDGPIVTVSNSTFSDALCIVQGAVSLYGTVASFLLSMLVAVYLLVLTQSSTKKPASRLVPIIYIVSWGIPIIVVCAVAAEWSYGYEPISTPGWCFSVGRSSIHSFSGVLADILSYELWAGLCFLVLTVLYSLLFCSIYLQCKGCKRKSNTQYGQAKGDVKLQFVPFIFILLRIWTTITDVGLAYINPSQQIAFKCSTAAAVLTVLSGIGLNAQGFANTILFCLCTKQVREQLSNSLWLSWLRIKLWCKRKCHNDYYFDTSFSAQFDTVKFLTAKQDSNSKSYGSSEVNRSKIYDTWTE